jgi:hypothetical protein
LSAALIGFHHGAWNSLNDVDHLARVARCLQHAVRGVPTAFVDTLHRRDVLVGLDPLPREEQVVDPGDRGGSPLPRTRILNEERLVVADIGCAGVDDRRIHEPRVQDRIVEHTISVIEVRLDLGPGFLCDLGRTARLR